MLKYPPIRDYICCWNDFVGRRLPGGASEIANLENLPDANHPASEISSALRVAAIVLRKLFVVLLLVLTLRVSLPQNETIWTAYDTPADLVRLILGLGVCAWLAVPAVLARPQITEAFPWASASAYLVRDNDRASATGRSLLDRRGKMVSLNV